ncbi:MAG: hypothetical protein Q8O19_05780 [Rectinemataceae bacterium]|nr:hypothetical protein [Rectinemataceae bacterium]
MLRCGNQLRLHKEDVDRLFKLTGANANEVRSVDELNCFVDRHLPMFEGGTPESALLRLLLADEKISSKG